jgi:hypothetical protein
MNTASVSAAMTKMVGPKFETLIPLPVVQVKQEIMNM